MAGFCADLLKKEMSLAGKPSVELKKTTLIFLSSCRLDLTLRTGITCITKIFPQCQIVDHFSVSKIHRYTSIHYI
jgi:hypothetical protein